MSPDMELEKLRILVGYAEHAGQVFWTRFNVFSALSGLLLVAWAKEDTLVERLVVAIAGLSIAASWVAINARSSLYFRKTMRGVKEQASVYGLDTLAEGLDDADIRGLAPKGLTGIIVRGLGRLRMTWVAVGVSAVFVLVWLIVLVSIGVQQWAC